MPVEYMITLEPTENIDHDFLTIVERILNKTVEIEKPGRVYLVQIDNWFDFKWLEFKSSNNDNDSLGWRNKLMLPPFEPSRVLSQLYFQLRTSPPRLYEVSPSKPLHILMSRRSVAEICSSGVFVWYSFAGTRSDRGSLMVYVNNDGRGSAWYASFVKNPNWQVNKMKGIPQRELTELMTVADITDGI